MRKRISSSRAGIVADEIRLQRAERGLGRLAAAAHLAQPDQAVVGLDLDDGADEPPPVAAVRVAQRRLERNGDGGRADVGDLHRVTDLGRISRGAVATLDQSRTSLCGPVVQARMTSAVPHAVLVALYVVVPILAVLLASRDVRAWLRGTGASGRRCRTRGSGSSSSDRSSSCAAR